MRTGEQVFLWRALEARIQSHMSLGVPSTLVLAIVCLFLGLVGSLLLFLERVSHLLTWDSLGRLCWLTSPLLDYHAAFMPARHTVFMWSLGIGLLFHKTHFYQLSCLWEPPPLVYFSRMHFRVAGHKSHSQSSTSEC